MNYRRYNEYTKELIKAVKSEDLNELIKVIEKYKDILGKDFIEYFKNSNEDVKKLTLYKIMLGLNISNEYNVIATDYILTYKYNHRKGNA